jgi:hypothetical protein
MTADQITPQMIEAGAMALRDQFANRCRLVRNRLLSFEIILRRGARDALRTARAVDLRARCFAIMLRPALGARLPSAGASFRFFENAAPTPTGSAKAGTTATGKKPSL